MSVESQPTAHIKAVLPLKHGDQLTRDEFERRYEAMPHLKKAERIRGERNILCQTTTSASS